MKKPILSLQTEEQNIEKSSRSQKSWLGLLVASAITVAIFLLLYFVCGFLVQKLTLDQVAAVTELLAVLVWPLVVLVAIYVFRDPMRSFIGRLDSIKSSWFEARVSQPKDNMDESRMKQKEKGDGLSVGDKNLKKLKEGQGAKDLVEAGGKNKAKQIEILKGLVDYLIVRAEAYEFIYLKNFLVLNTKLALLWFYRQRKVTMNLYLEKYSLNLPPILLDQYLPQGKADRERKEKMTMYDVLLRNGLLSLEGDFIEVTPKGKNFLHFIKFIGESE